MLIYLFSVDVQEMMLKLYWPHTIPENDRKTDMIQKER